MPSAFHLGQTYLTIMGKPVKIVDENRETHGHYDTVKGDDGIWRYDRYCDRGRVTGAKVGGLLDLVAPLPLDLSKRTLHAYQTSTMLIRASQSCLELLHLPRGRLCLVAPAAPLTNFQRGIELAKTVDWLPKTFTLLEAVL